MQQTIICHINHVLATEGNIGKIGDLDTNQRMISKIIDHRHLVKPAMRLHTIIEHNIKILPRKVTQPSKALKQVIDQKLNVFLVGLWSIRLGTARISPILYLNQQYQNRSIA
jgi:hypothetical protein